MRIRTTARGVAIAVAMGALAACPHQRPTDPRLGEVKPVPDASSLGTTAVVADASSLDAAEAPAASMDTDPDAWLAARGAHAAVGTLNNVWGCLEIIVGTDSEQALVCDEAEQVSCCDDVDRVVTHRIVRVVRAAKIVSVLDAPTRIDALDAPPAHPNRPRSPSMLDLTLTIAPDGRSATILDEGVCQRLAAERRPQGEEAPRAFDRDLQRRSCKARGEYVWKRGRFAR